jgi:hypothetical protein
MAKKARASGGKSGGKSRWDWLFWGALVVVIGFAIYFTHSTISDWYNNVFRRS